MSAFFNVITYKVSDSKESSWAGEVDRKGQGNRVVTEILIHPVKIRCLHSSFFFKNNYITLTNPLGVFTYFRKRKTFNIRQFFIYHNWIDISLWTYDWETMLFSMREF